jgi:hypothetical protein
MIYEQKFGDIVPNLQVGYIDAKDVPYLLYCTQRTLWQSNPNLCPRTTPV